MHTTLSFILQYLTNKTTWEEMCLRNNHVYASTHNSLLATTCDYMLTQLVTASTRLDNTLDLFFTDFSQIPYGAKF